MTLFNSILETFIYGFIGLFMSVLAYKVTDWLIPGDLGKQVGIDNNLSVAVVAGAAILGMCIIIAASIHG